MATDGECAPAGDTLRAMIDGLEVLAGIDRGMTLSCVRLLLVLGRACEVRAEGVPVLELARMLATPRTNVTRNLQYLRERGWVETVKDAADARIDLNRPTAAGLGLLEAVRRGPVRDA